MSDSVQSQRQQPTRLPRPWDSPGKNIGVGCHFLLQCMKVKSESEVTQSCLTPSDPMDCSLPGSSIHGIFQARVLEWGAIAFSEVASSNFKKATEWTFPSEPPDSMGPASTWISAQSSRFLISDFQSSKVIKLCCFKLLYLW